MKKVSPTTVDELQGTFQFGCSQPHTTVMKMSGGTVVGEGLNMKIRKAIVEDLPEIRKLSKKFEFEIDRDWKGLISSKDSEMFVLMKDESIIGFTGLIRYAWNNTLQISNIFIKPEYRRKGLGFTLVNFLVDKSRKTRYRCLIAEASSLNPVVDLYKKTMRVQ